MGQTEDKRIILSLVQDLIPTNEIKAAETLRFGTSPVERFIFIDSTLYTTPIATLATAPLI
ncbi:hypothetical protein Leryth_007100, partial [Lithospermum erythrorhizon]